MRAGSGQYLVAGCGGLPARHGEGAAIAGARRNERRGGVARTSSVTRQGTRGCNGFQPAAIQAGSQGAEGGIHQVGPTLPRPQAATKIINTVAGRLPLSAKRPTHPAMVISQGRVAKCPPRLAKEVRSSEPVPTLPDVRVRRTLADRVQAQLRHQTAQALVVVAGSGGGQEPAWHRLDSPRASRAAGPSAWCADCR